MRRPAPLPLPAEGERAVEVAPTRGRLLGAVVLGVLVGLGGTALHRSGVTIPWGIALAVALAVTMSFFVRAACSRPAVGLFAAGVVLTVLTLTYAGPGGDVLVTGEGPSKAWLTLGPVASLLAWFAPARLFAEYSGVDVEPEFARGSR